MFKGFALRPISNISGLTQAVARLQRARMNLAVTAARLAFLSGTIFGAWPAISAADAQVGKPPTVETTQVTVVAPALVRGPAQKGRCWTTSIALPRKGAWRCMVGNAIHDPCFQVAGKTDAVVCGADPTQRRAGFTLRLAEPLPQQKAPVTSPRPWIVELADGSKCRPYTGTMPFVEGLPPLSYYCQTDQTTGEGESALLEDFKVGKPWTVTKIRYAESAGAGMPLRLISRERVPVKAIWQ
jgi:hypothetical protein